MKHSGYNGFRKTCEKLNQASTAKSSSTTSSSTTSSITTSSATKKKPYHAPTAGNGNRLKPHNHYDEEHKHEARVQGRSPDEPPPALLIIHLGCLRQVLRVKT